MDFQKPDERAIEWWSVKRFITFLVVGILGVTAIILMNLLDANGGIWFFVKIMIGLLSALLLVAIPVLPKIEYRQWGYKILEDQVVIRHGIFWISETVIPIIRIQNITKNQGPLARMFDLFDVEIAIASGAFDICGVTENTANSISQNLKSRLYNRIEAKENENGASAGEEKENGASAGEEKEPAEDAATAVDETLGGDAVDSETSDSGAANNETLGGGAD